MKFYLFVLSVMSKFDFNTITALNAYFALQLTNQNIHKYFITAYFGGNLLTITLFYSLKQQFSVFVLLKYGLFFNWLCINLLFLETEALDSGRFKHWLFLGLIFCMAMSNLILNSAFAALASQMKKNSILINMTGSGASAVLTNGVLLLSILMIGEDRTDYLVMTYLGIANISYFYLIQGMRRFENFCKLKYQVSSFVGSSVSLEFRRSLVDVAENEPIKSDKNLFSEVSNLMFGLFFVFFVFIGCFPGLLLQYNLGFKNILNDVVITSFVNAVSVLPRIFMHFYSFERNIDNHVHILTILRFGFFKLFKYVVINQTGSVSNRTFFMLLTSVFALTTGFSLTYFATGVVEFFSNKQNQARIRLLAYYVIIFRMSVEVYRQV